MVSNLHSIFSGKWMITDDYTNAHLPLLLNILQRGNLPEKVNSTKSFYFLDRQGNYYDEDDEALLTGDSSVEEDLKKIGVINMKSPIMKYSQWCTEGTKAMMAKMKDWEKDSSIIGTFFDVDSGGGQVSGTPEFAEFIHKYSKPTVSYTDGYMCSAAYYLNAGTKKIFANKHAEYVGSLGTMVKTLLWDKYYESLGIEVIEEYATKSTQKNKASRDLKAGNIKAFIEEYLDPSNDTFHNEMKTYRPQLKKEVFSGKEYHDMNEAIEVGLIDAIGTREEALDYLFKLSEGEDTSTPDNTQNQDIDMSQTNYEMVAAAIGQEEVKISAGFLTGKKGYLLNESQLNLLQDKLASSEASLSNLQQTTQVAQQRATEAEATNTKLKGAVEAALETAGLAAGANLEASIKLLGDKVKEYGNQPGAKPSKATATADPQIAEEEDSIVDMNAGHNQILVR